MAKLPKSSKQKGFLVIGCVIVLGVIYIFSPILVGQVLGTKIKAVFAQQKDIFSGPIASLGIKGQPSTEFQCIDERHTYWQTEMICESFASYPYNPSPMSETDKNSYAFNAAKFDQLLKQNGWVPDRPQDPVTTLAGMDVRTPLGSFESSELPLHKNIGSISCNLEIDLSNNSGAEDSVSISINSFSCQQTIKFFMLHPTNWQASGP